LSFFLNPEATLFVIPDAAQRRSGTRDFSIESKDAGFRAPSAVKLRTAPE